MSYQDVKNKLYRGHRKIVNNTYLELWEKPDYGDEWIDMRLHGNLVAEFRPNYLKLYSAGWHSVTTKSRLNLALKLAGIYTKCIFQQDWVWYYGNYNPNATKFKDGMKISYKGLVLDHVS